MSAPSRFRNGAEHDYVGDHHLRSALLRMPQLMHPRGLTRWTAALSALQDTKRRRCQGMTAEADASSCSATTSWATSANARTAQRTMGSLRRDFQACATLCSDAEITDRARNCFSSGKLPTSSHWYRRSLVVFAIDRTVRHEIRSPSKDGMQGYDRS